MFVEDTRSVPIGRILKVDGQYAAVKFPTTSPSSDAKDDADAWQDCRLMKKDDLQVMKSATTSRVPDCFQKTPRRIILTTPQSSLFDTTHQQLLTIAVDAKGIHTIMKAGSKLHYCLFNLNTGRQEHDSSFPTDINAFLGLSQSNVSLKCANETADSVLILRDGNNTIYPLVKDCLDSIRDPQWLDLQPIKCLAATTLTLNSVGANLKSQVAILALVPEAQLFMPRILRCDFKGFKNVLAQIEASSDAKSQIASILNERCDGNRNILHACVSMCSPTSNKDNDDATTPANAGATTNLTTSGSGASQSATLDCVNSGGGSGSSSVANNVRDGRVSIREMMRRANSLRDIDPIPNNPSAGVDDSVFTSYWPPEYDLNSGDEDSMNGMNTIQAAKTATVTYVSDPAERRENAVLILGQICQSAAMQPHLKQLLSAKDGHGQTPFMLAVSARAYQAGKILLNIIQQISNNDASVRDSMIFPVGSSPDQSPLYVLCCNDTCSFTWTGADHINQDIFECKTCGLTGSLCCCTECAKVCHKGHDCKLKKTSPTAYCDCWEKCKCKALIAGNQTKRFELLNKLVTETDLVTRVNSRNEPILLFLIQTVGRQTNEQRQYRSRARNASGNRKTPSLDADADMPDHDLEPPRFAKKALDRLLVDWNAVKAMIMTGADDQDSGLSHTFFNETDEQNTSLQGQSGTTLVDKFTHSLFVRCHGDPLDTLLITLNKELQNTRIPNRVDEAQKVARRFIRSVARVFVIFSLERTPNPEKKINSNQLKHLQTCRRVFQTLIKISIEELIETADALIAPVRMGVVRPTAPFTMSSSSVDVSFSSTKPIQSSSLSDSDFIVTHFNFLLLFSFLLLQSADDLFSVEPLAPSALRDGHLDGRGGARGNDDQSSGFLSRLDVNYRLRQMDDTIDNDAVVDNTGDDEEASEQDDVASERDRHNSTRSNIDDDGQDGLRNEEVVQEGESDNEFFHEAESESDSDDNQSTQDAQRSVQTGATAGSDTGEVFIQYRFS